MSNVAAKAELSAFQSELVAIATATNTELDRLLPMVPGPEGRVVDAMRYAFSSLKLVVEPGGAVGLAALLSGKIKAWGDGITGLVLSGGNVDPALFADILADG